MYTFFKRTAPDPNLITFDCPDANVANAFRGRSNTPIQALATLHNEVFFEAAQALSKRVLVDEAAGSDTERLSAAWRICLSRPPETAELRPLHALLKTSRAYYETHPDEAAALLSRHRVSDVPVGEQAAWVATLRMILNLDEFINRG